MLIAALFVVVKRWKQSKDSSTDKWINKLWLKKYISRTSLLVQWLRFRTSIVGVQVQSLFGKLRSHVPRTTAKKYKCPVIFKNMCIYIIYICMYICISAMKKTEVLIHTTVDVYGEPWKHYSKWKKSDMKSQILYDSIYMKYPEWINP